MISAQKILNIAKPKSEIWQGLKTKLANFDNDILSLKKISATKQQMICKVNYDSQDFEWHINFNDSKNLIIIINHQHPIYLGEIQLFLFESGDQEFAKHQTCIALFACFRMHPGLIEADNFDLNALLDIFTKDLLS